MLQVNEIMLGVMNFELNVNEKDDAAAQLLPVSSG